MLIKLAGNGVLLLSTALLGLIWEKKIPFCVDENSISHAREITLSCVGPGTNASSAISSLMLAFATSIVVKAIDMTLEAHPEREKADYKEVTWFNFFLAGLAFLGVIYCLFGLIDTFVSLQVSFNPLFGYIQETLKVFLAAVCFWVTVGWIDASEERKHKAFVLVMLALSVVIVFLLYGVVSLLIK